jgi:glycosyltransferase involved in cell wall biosynthesis
VNAICALIAGAARDVGHGSRHQFIQRPAEWHHARDAINQALAAEPTIESGCAVLLYSPHGTLNSYQDLLYREAGSAGIDTRPIALLDPLSPVLLSSMQHKPVFFHQHWLKDIYWDAETIAEGELRIDRHLGTVCAMKELGVCIIWTLHNLVEHDATELQSTLGAYARAGMARLADHILFHTRGAVDALEEATGVGLASRAMVLPHPLYDDLRENTTATLPPELGGDISTQRIWLLTGLLRPYKGMQELLRVWQRVLDAESDHPVHLVIAGHIQDPPVHPLIAAVKARAAGRLTVIPRRLEDGELAALVRRAELVLAPYRQVLTSGTYYLATTFSKPVLAPAKGMFPEVVEHGQSGWLYDGSEEALEQSLRALMQQPPETFRQVGSEARSRNEDANASAVSRRFFEWLLSLQN